MEWPGTISLSALDKLRIECGVDEALRRRMLDDPVGVLAERGVTVPEGVGITVVEDTMDTHTVTLPPFVGRDLSSASLASNAQSTWECTTCTTTTPTCVGSLASLICTVNKL
jgi:hypothetical protein